jgi:hypothetical protein
MMDRRECGRKLSYAILILFQYLPGGAEENPRILCDPAEIRKEHLQNIS